MCSVGPHSFPVYDLSGSLHSLTFSFAVIPPSPPLPISFYSPSLGAHRGTVILSCPGWSKANSIWRRHSLYKIFLFLLLILFYSYSASSPIISFPFSHIFFPASVAKGAKGTPPAPSRPCFGSRVGTADIACYSAGALGVARSLRATASFGAAWVLRLMSSLLPHSGTPLSPLGNAPGW